ncbi:antibiotic biosynthesis monooxygenase [Microbispora amethystogenes]|uniref:antibiotic biosynthesis monooxygenase n=1 Tax=Microbispora amethystogenes TaxID=1427754 RepID=UPI0033D4EA3A
MDKEIYPPGDGMAGEWVVVFRFARTDQLEAWLNSPRRRRLLEKGRGLLAWPEDQEVLVGEPPAHRTVTVVIAHRVTRSAEPAFLRWQEKVQEKFPGFLGFELFRPVPGLQDDWVSVFRFDTREHLENWLGSVARRKLLDEGRGIIASYDVRRIDSAFSGWFRFTGDSAKGTGPPGWKQAMSVILGLYPVLIVLGLTLDRALNAARVPGYLHVFAGCVVAVGILNWPVMPIVTRVLRFWLAPGEEAPRRVHLMGALVVVLGYAALLALAGWTAGRL